MATLRIPFALFSGLMFSLAAFFGLWQLIGAPLDVAPLDEATKIVFTPQFRPTPVAPPPRERVEREPPVVEPTVPPIGIPGDDNRVTKVTFTRPTIDRVERRHGIGLRGVDGDIIPLVRPNPDYPPRAITGEIEGWVQVRFTVTAIGSVRDAVVVASEPGTIFDDAALKAIARWRYNPRVDGGIAVERVGLETIIRFELEK